MPPSPLGDPAPDPSHRLHRLELEISSGEEPLARSAMDRLSRLHHAALESLLERVFSELSPPGRWDRLERLELDLGTLQATNLEQQLPQRLEVALRRALAARLPPRQPPPLPPQLPQAPADPNRPQPPTATVPPAAATAPARPAGDADGLQRQLELLAVFTATGTLPWWAARHDRQLIAAALDTALALPPPELRALLRQLTGPPGEPSAALQRLLAAASPLQRPQLEQALEAALQAEAPDATPSTIAAPEAPAEPEPNPPSPSALDTALALPPPELRALLRQLTGPPGEPSAALQRLLAAASPLQRPQLEQALEAALQGDAVRAAREDELQTPRADAPPAPQPGAADDNELVIDGAGVVLLWPFLESLFSHLELINGDRVFAGEAQRRRAMALLGFLVDGDGDPPEWRLTLAKLLCGALPLAPYGLESPLSDGEQAEAEGLLQAVLGHAAGRLGDDGTSLRQEFLQRPGLLSARPGAWVLQVERRPVDLVLDGLPWSWSWIRLPWMDDLLQVVW